MKKTIFSISIAIISLLAFSGCTSVLVHPVDAEHSLKHVCIRENPAVRVSDFLKVVRDGFQRHNISTDVFSDETPENCQFTLRYTALQSWDFFTYLHYAELWLRKGEEKVGYAEYRLKGQGGLSLTKFQSTKGKMDPIIDELLKAY